MSLWIGASKKLEDIDIPRIGARIRVGEDELHAVMDVEARGSGFDKSGRVVMLYEPHIFFKEVQPHLKAEAIGKNLAYQKWGTQSYPKESYTIFEKALKLDENAAYRSCSWGFGQIMGFNCELAGYKTAQAMVGDFAKDEENHLNAMVNFIIAAKLDDNLRGHDWDGFAHGYNGPAYARHGYHTKLADRYKFWAGKPDTPWTPASRGCACPVAA